ncbi:hypothetical protein ACFY6U_51330 [Streptomyces sp. NPDC013157]
MLASIETTSGDGVSRWPLTYAKTAESNQATITLAPLLIWA